MRTSTTDTTTSPSPSGRQRPAWLVPAAVLAAAALAVVLALTQPWLLLVDTVVDEQLPTAAAEQPAAEEDAPSEEPATAADEETSEDAAAPAASPPEPVVLRTGSFTSRDHPTSGEVAILELPDGSRVLTIEGLQTDNGPDLFVYLDDDPADAPEDDFDDGTDLGRLRGNVGDLVYELPDDLDLDAIASVAIWCDRFSSLFGAADLLPVG